MRADPKFPNLFPADNKNLVNKNITPKLGSEIRGVQLTNLDAAGKEELALLVAQRGVVVLREQDFAKKGPEYAVAVSYTHLDVYKRQIPS